MYFLTEVKNHDDSVIEYIGDSFPEKSVWSNFGMEWEHSELKMSLFGNT